MIPFQAWRPERSEGQDEGRGGSRESSDVLRHLQDIFQGGPSKDKKCLFVWWQDTGDLQSDADDFWDEGRVLSSWHQHDYAREKGSCHEDRELGMSPPFFLWTPAALKPGSHPSLLSPQPPYPPAAQA